MTGRAMMDYRQIFFFIQTTIYCDIQNEDPQIYVLKQL